MKTSKVLTFITVLSRIVGAMQLTMIICTSWKDLYCSAMIASL